MGKVLIIAEASANHNGAIKIAKMLISDAKHVVNLNLGENLNG